MSDTENIVPFNDGQVRWADGFINLLAGLGVPGRDKFASQNYTHAQLNSVELENAYRSDWVARKVITIPAWDMTREWRSWQADPDQIELLENLEKKLFIQQRVQQAIVKARLYGGACILIGVDVGKPEEELDPEDVGQDALKFIHVVSKNQLRAGPIIRDISSKYFGQPEFYEAANEPANKSFEQEIDKSKATQAFSALQVKVHPSRVVKLIGMDTADQMLNDIWGDSALQAVNDAVKMCGLVTGSLATLVAELKVDVIKIPELKSILSTSQGTNKMLARFSAANAAKSVINTILIDGNEEWQRIQASLTGVPETMMAYMQIAAGAADIPATRFLGMSPSGLNATGESDIRNYYDRLASEQETILTPTMTVLDDVLIRSALGDKPPGVWYEWRSLWQLAPGEKAELALKKAQTYQIDVNAAQLPPVALANARANQLIEDGFYPGLEQALEDAALEGDTIEEQNAAPEMDPLMEAQKTLAENGMAPPPGQPGGPPMPPKPGGFPPKKGNPFVAAAGKPPLKVVVGGRDSLQDFNQRHLPAGSPKGKGGEFAPKQGGEASIYDPDRDPELPLTPEEERAYSEKLARPENVAEYEHHAVDYHGSFETSPYAALFTSKEEFEAAKHAIEYYKLSDPDSEEGAPVINDSLRGKRSTSPITQKAIDDLDLAFERTARSIMDYRTKQPKEAWLYRGITNRAAAKFLKMKVGDEFEDSGFSSTTINPTLATQFARQRGRGGILAEITVPAGFPVMPVQNHGFQHEEDEVLLRRGTRFRVTKVGKNMELRVIR